MSIAGLEKLMVPRMRDCCQTWSNQPHTAQCDMVPSDSGSTMGYVPHPPPPLPLLPDGKRQPISAADDSTFEEWVKLPVEDLRTIEEYAANPVPLVRRFPFPPPPPPSTPPRITGELKSSFPKGPPNRLIIGGVQPDKPWPRK